MGGGVITNTGGITNRGGIINIGGGGLAKSINVQSNTSVFVMPIKFRISHLLHEKKINIDTSAEGMNSGFGVRHTLSGLNLGKKMTESFKVLGLKPLTHLIRLSTSLSCFSKAIRTFGSC